MVEFLSEHQLKIMLFLSGACGILAIMSLMTKSMSRKRKIILALMEVSAMILLICDRFAYIYRGNVSTLGYYMVRICNGVVYAMSLIMPFLVTRYLVDLYKTEGKLEKTPILLRLCDTLFVIGSGLLITSFFTGLYYTFDEYNQYQRSPGCLIFMIVPLVIVILQESAIILHWTKLKKHFAISLMISVAAPTAASILQIFAYGVSLTNITIAFVVIVFYVFALYDLNNAAERAKEHELEYYKRAQKKEAALFEQTTEALATAIDAKDKYTSGHSSRVALYSELIAKEAGYSEKDCKKVYFAALLHDVGKIGVKNDIINKKGRLTDEEFEQVKLHTVYGYQILSSIKQSPSLSIGAHYHHERFDGKGYPEGIAGDEIPEIARIIAVADAYDAMTSKRSYRDPLSLSEVRDEFQAHSGTQFDPVFAKIMIHLIDSKIDFENQEDKVEQAQYE